MNMNWISKIRPQVLIGILSLTAIAITGAILDRSYAEVVIAACVVGIAGILPKLVESDAGN